MNDIELKLCDIRGRLFEEQLLDVSHYGTGNGNWEFEGDI